MKRVLMSGGAFGIAVGALLGIISLINDGETLWRLALVLMLSGIGATMLVTLMHNRSIKHDTAITRDRTVAEFRGTRTAHADVMLRLREINNRAKLIEGRSLALSDRAKAIDKHTRDAMAQSSEADAILVDMINRVRSDNRALHELLLANVIENRSQINGDAIRETLDHRYRQIEALLALYALIDNRTAVPTLGGWSASPDLCRFIVDHILTTKPLAIVELGSGASTVLMATAAKATGLGHVLSFEHIDEHAVATTRALKDAGLEDWATVLLVTLDDVTVDGEPMTWYDIADEDLPPTIDMLFVDGPPASTGPLARLPAMIRLHDRLADGALTILDDAHRPSESETIDRWATTYEDLDIEILNHEKGTAAIWRRRPTADGPRT